MRRLVATTALAAAALVGGATALAVPAAAAASGVVASACQPPAVDLGGLAVRDLPMVDFFGVPQLGCEPVSGTGCGGDGSIGPVIPDGLWRGMVTSFNGPTVWDSTSLEFDLWCLYRGDAAEQRAADWIAEHGDDDYGPPWLGDEFIVNNNPRTRTVTFPFAPFTAAAVWMPVAADAEGYLSQRCVAGYGAPPLEIEDIVGWEAWLYIEDGVGQQVIRACPYG